MSQAALDFTPRPVPAQYPVGDYFQKLPTKLIAFRAHMADGLKHGSPELTRLFGHRFGDLFYRLHRSDEPFHYERHPDPEDDTHVSYRQCGPETCVICLAPVRRSLRAQVRMLEEQVRALMERNAELEARNG